MTDFSSAPRRRLTVAMIAMNEAATIGATIESVRGIADEIVVVDNGSRDNTVAIAQSQGAKIIRREWDDDFAAARNAAYPAITGDWILWIDAGERLCPSDAAPLAAFVRGQADSGKAYLIFVELPEVEPGGSRERVGRLRLLPRSLGPAFRGRVRESILAGMAAAGMQADFTPWTLSRGEREHQERYKKERAERNLRLVDLEIAERGPIASLLICAGESYVALGDRARAAEMFRSALGLASPGSTELREAYYGLLTTFADDAASRQEQLAMCIAALEQFPADAQMLCAMGGYLQAQGRPDLAQRSYEAANRLGQIDPSAWHIHDLGEVSAACLATTWQMQLQENAARQTLEEALLRFPNSTRLRRQLIDLHVKAGRAREALNMASSLPLAPTERDSLRSAIRGAVQAAQGNWVSSLAYLETAYGAGCRDSLCMRWLFWSMLETGQRANAEFILKEWDRLPTRTGEVEALKRALEDRDRNPTPTQTPMSDSMVRRDAPQPASSPHKAIQAFDVDAHAPVMWED